MDHSGYVDGFLDWGQGKCIFGEYFILLGGFRLWIAVGGWVGRGYDIVVGFQFFIVEISLVFCDV
jgi:hypothetical protein